MKMKNKTNTYGGYAGRLLRVDLTGGKIDYEETSRYLPDWIGGRGIAARIAWDEILPGTGASCRTCWPGRRRKGSACGA